MSDFLQEILVHSAVASACIYLSLRAYKRYIQTKKKSPSPCDKDSCGCVNKLNRK